jgi:phospholipid/cholesterol/gamma-HCH transport system ATP-binding protein
MLQAGRIVWRGPAGEIDRSDNPYVEQFIQGRGEGPISAAV